MSTVDLDHRFSLSRIQATVSGQAAAPVDIGRFRVLRRIGRGAFGVVFEVRDQNSGERLALKTLRARPREKVNTLIAEFRAVAEIDHPNLVRLYELDATEQPYFVMELIDGIDIAAALEGLARKQDWPSFRELLRQLGAGLSALHERGFVHCDIKPSNALVTPEGRVVLLDFGLTRSASHSASSRTVGTPGYIAPERFEAATTPPGPAVDIYAVGILAASAASGLEPNDSADQLLRALPDSMPAELRCEITALCATRPQLRPSAATLAGRESKQSRTPEPAFVGRIQELQRLLAHTSELRSAKTVLVEGASGSGKTTLVTRVSQQLRAQGFLVLTGRCHEREQVPYGGIDQVADDLARHLEGLPTDVARYLLAGRAHELATAFPSFARLADRDESTELAAHAGNLDDDVGGTLKRLLRRVCASERVLLWIDDVQWLDSDGARLLRRLLREPDRPELCFVASCRRAVAERRPRVLELVERLRQDKHCLRISLSGLPPDEATTLVKSVVGEVPQEHLASILEQSGSNPFLLIEFSRRWQAETKEAGWFSHRIDHLSPAARRVLDAIAVADGPIEREVLLAAASAQDSGVRSIDELRLGKFISTDAADGQGTVDCAHARIRQAALDRIEDRRGIHRTLVHAFMGLRPENHAAIAWHAHHSSMAEVAFVEAEAAANAAELGGAFHRAGEFWSIAFEHAHDLAGRRRCALRRAQAWSRARRSPAAAALFMEAADLLDGPEQSDARMSAAREFFMAGEVDRARTVASEVSPRLDRVFRRSAPATIFHILATRARLFCRGLSFHRREEADIAREELVDAEALWIAGLGVAHTDLLQCGLINDLCVEYALRLGEPKRIARALAMACVTMTGVKGRSTPRARRFMVEAEHLADETDDLYTRGMVKLYLSYVHSSLGDWRRSVELAEHADRLLRESRASALELQFADTALLNSLRLLGEYGPFMRRCDTALDAAMTSDNPKVRCDMRTWASFACIMRDDVEGSLAQIEAMNSELSIAAYSHIQVAQTSCKMRALMYRGSYGEALPWFEENTRVSRRKGWWFLLQVRADALAWRARAAAALYAETRDPALARRALADARRLESESWPGVIGSGACVRASIKKTDGEHEAAVRLLRRAVADFDVANTKLELMSVRHRLAEYVSEHEAKTLRRQVEEYRQEHQLVSVERLARLTVPPPV